MKKRYPASLFVIGFVTNIIFHFFWLFVPAVICLIIGIFSRNFLYIGLTILLFDVIISLIEQINIRSAFMSDSDNPDFRGFQDALSKDGKWNENLMEFLDERLENHPQDQNGQNENSGNDNNDDNSPE